MTTINILHIIGFIFGVIDFLRSSIFDYLIMFIFVLIFVKETERLNVKQLFASLGYRKNNILKSIVFGFVFMGLAILTFYPSIFNINDAIPQWIERFDSLRDPLHALSIFFGAGFVEETAFTGYILTRLVPKGKLSFKKTILPLTITYILHMVWHWPFGFSNPVYWTLTNNALSFIFGIMGGVIMLKTKNLAGPIVFHILTDIF